MSERVFNVLFLCTQNSARSIIAESIMNRFGKGKFRGYSAGSQPRGKINPYTIELLKNFDYDVSALRSKSWDEFARPGAPKMDFVFTVCDDAAKEACPVWPGQPITAHWGVPDPSRVQGTDAGVRFAFVNTLRMLRNRIELLSNLPLASLERLALQRKVGEIGRMMEGQE
jgi:arsenate reductase